MNNTTSVHELSFAIHNAYQFLLNNEIDLFIDNFANINTQFVKSTDDNMLLLKVIDDIKQLMMLIDLKSKEISQQILATRKHATAHNAYQDRF